MVGRAPAELQVEPIAVWHPHSGILIWHCIYGQRGAGRESTASVLAVSIDEYYFYVCILMISLHRIVVGIKENVDFS